MDRYRLIGSIVVLFVYLLVMYPWQTMIVTIILAIIYFFIKNVVPDNDTTISANHRRAALREAKIYLAPYSDIWRSLKLSNLNCSLYLGRDGTTITGRDSKHPERRFKVIRSRVHQINLLWDMFCTSFDHKTNYDRLLELCATFQVDISMEGEEDKMPQSNNYVQDNKKELNEKVIKIDINEDSRFRNNREKLDVNNASEMELTALPGISIVLAKKIIKRRDEIGGFKDVNAFLEFTGLKPHMRLQLRDLVCVNKMKGSGKIKRYSERSIDL